MSTLAKWDPLRELNEFSSRFSNAFASEGRNRNENGWFTKAQWAPLVDISEDEEEYLIRAELPGLEKDHVKVTVENGTLMISGERAMEREDENLKYHRVERSYGNFIRAFSLPNDADGAKIRAEFKNGILKVHLPKSEDAKPKSIEIKVN
jgi:HSP20 family protein